MKVGTVLAGVAGLLLGSAAVSRGEYLQHLELCSESELRRRLENKDVLGAREIMQRRGIYSRIRDERLDGYFAMVGMMSADETWHSEYVGVFGGRGKLDVVRNEEMIKRLMNEMVTGEAWMEVAARGLEEECNNAREARSEDLRPSSVVAHIASEVGRWQRPPDRRWRRALEILLRKDGMRAGLVEGRYNEEMRKIISKGGELEDALYDYVGRHGVLRDMMDKNKDEALVREMVANMLEQGCWLYMDKLEKAMGTERARKLFGEDNAFGKIRARYGVEEEELSIERLKVLAEEGRLDELVKRVIMRLVRYGKIHDLGRATRTVERRVLDKLLIGGQLDVALGEGIERLIRHGWIDDLEMLIRAVERGRVFDKLLSRGELDAALGEGIRSLIRHGWIDRLKRLIEAVEGRVFDALVAGRELDVVLREGMGKLISEGEMHDLEWLIKAVERGGVFGELLSRGELDAALSEGTEKLIRHGWIDKLKRLLEAVEGRSFDVLVTGGKLDSALKGGIRKLVRYGAVNELRMLLEIEVVGRRVSGGLLSVGELDMVFKEMVDAVIEDKSGDEDGVCDLKTAMEEGVFSGLVSRKRLRRAWWKVRMRRARASCAIA